MQVYIKSRCGQFVFDKPKEVEIKAQEAEKKESPLSIPDSTEAALIYLAPLGRFSTIVEQGKITLFFENDYD